MIHVRLTKRQRERLEPGSGSNLQRPISANQFLHAGPALSGSTALKMASGWRDLWGTCQPLTVETHTGPQHASWGQNNVYG